MQTPKMELPTMEQRHSDRNQPEESVVMHQSWRDLLFLHWPIDSAIIRDRLPPGLQVDLFENEAWIGIVPFRMLNVRPRCLPAVPGLSNFKELNLRTYVYDKFGRPGVWFFSLDSSHGLANWIARTFFHLNYLKADMRCTTNADGQINYRSRRKNDTIVQDFEWLSGNSTHQASEGSLEFFLAERYRLFAYNYRRKKLYTGKVHHTPYPLKSVHLRAYSTHLFDLNKLLPPTQKPASALASDGVDVTVYPLQAV